MSSTKFKTVVWHLEHNEIIIQVSFFPTPENWHSPDISTIMYMAETMIMSYILFHKPSCLTVLYVSYTRAIGDRMSATSTISKVISMQFCYLPLTQNILYYWFSRVNNSKSWKFEASTSINTNSKFWHFEGPPVDQNATPNKKI